VDDAGSAWWAMRIAPLWSASIHLSPAVPDDAVAAR
jgi:hypothetical protein